VLVRSLVGKRTELKADPALKGKRYGNCNRTICQLGLVRGKTYYSATMQAYYCNRCARMINDRSPDIIPPLCVIDFEAGRDRNEMQ
jgi:hypothetical protein